MYLSGQFASNGQKIASDQQLFLHTVLLHGHVNYVVLHTSANPCWPLVSLPVYVQFSVPVLANL